jgi:hypothetical protein
MILTAFAQTPVIKRTVQRHTKGSLLYPLLIPAGKLLLNPPDLHKASPRTGTHTVPKR